MTEALVTIQLKRLSEGGFVATSADLPGLVAQGRTVAETLEVAQDVARKIVESYREHGDPLPPKLRGKVNSKVELQIPVAFS